MRLVTRAVTTAGITVAGITVMSGMTGTAQADTTGGSPLLSGLNDTLKGTTDLVGDTLGTVTRAATPARTTPRQSATRQSATRQSAPRAPSGAGVNVGVRTPVARAGVGASVRAGGREGLSARAAVDVCLGTAECGGGAPPAPPVPPAPPGPPGEPGSPPVPSTPPAPAMPPATPAGGSGRSAAVTNALGTQNGSLPFTGAPVGVLGAMGSVLLLTGTLAVAATRRRRSEAGS